MDGGGILLLVVVVVVVRKASEAETESGAVIKSGLFRPKELYSRGSRNAHPPTQRVQEYCSCNASTKRNKIAQK